MTERVIADEPLTNVATLHLCLRETFQLLHQSRSSLSRAAAPSSALRYLDQVELRLIWAALHCCPSHWSALEFQSILHRNQVLGRTLGQLHPQG